LIKNRSLFKGRAGDLINQLHLLQGTSPKSTKKKSALSRLKRAVTAVRFCLRLQNGAEKLARTEKLRQQLAACVEGMQRAERARFKGLQQEYLMHGNKKDRRDKRGGAAPLVRELSGDRDWMMVDE
jgi:hypothetical protein